MFFLYFLVFSMPFFRHPVINAGGGILSVPKMAGLLGMLYVFAHVRQQGFPNYFGPRLSKLFLAIFTWAMISFLVQGRAPRIDVGDPSLLYISEFIFLILMITLIDTPKKVEWVFFVALASVAFASLYILREYQVYRSLGPNYRPDAKILGDANYFSMAAMLGFPIGFFWFLVESRPAYRRFLIAVLLLAGAGIAVSGSRGGLLALMVFMLFAAWRTRKMGQLVLLLLLIFPPMLCIPKNPIIRMLHPDFADKQGALARIVTWKAGMRMSFEHPITGIGLAQFRPKLADYTGVANMSKLAHNTYLEFAAELGIPCLVLYCWLLLETWRALARIRRAASKMNDRLLLNLATGMQGGLLGYLVSSFFLSSEYVRFFWFYVFVTIVLERLVQKWIVAQIDDSAPPIDSLVLPQRIPVIPGGWAAKGAE